jgi:serine/threonine-protein kinase
VPTYRLCIQCGTQYGVDQRNCPADGSALHLKTSDDPLIGKVIAERYHILELLGVGGMGRVYAAEHVALGRKSAVKVINPSLATAADAISRFNREAANASRINHPNIAQIYDFGESDGVLYLAMEFVEGEALSTMVQRLGPLSVTRAASVTSQVAEALGAAHLLGIVHRDLKPENIMIGRRHDGSDWVKVVDFGIAKTVEQDHGSQTVTMAGVALGTPEYMSPEQFAGEKLDHRTDIYSLGLVLFNILTGELPYPSVTSKDSLVKRLTSTPRPLAEAKPDIGWPPGLQTALDRALAPDAANRYNRVGDFSADVARAAERAPDAPRRAVEGPTAPTAAPIPQAEVKRPARPRPLPTEEPVAPPKRGSGVLLFFVLLLVGTVTLGAIYPREILRTAALLTGSADATTPTVPVATPDELPDVEVIPQGGTTATTPASTSRTARDTLAAARDTHPASERPSDSATRVSTAPATQRNAAPPPTAPSRADDSRSRNPLRHPWLKPNGDSGVTRDLGEGAGPDELLHAQLDELQGHLALGTRYASRADVAGARTAFHDAVDEGRGLKLADRTLTQRVDMYIRNAMRDAYQACQIARADTTNAAAATADCGTLFAW